MRRRAWGMLVLVGFSLSVLGCDQLSGKSTSKSKSSDSEESDDDSAKKKKKKKKKADDEEEETEPTATATASAEPTPSAEPSAEPTAEPTAEASASAAPTEEAGGVKRYSEEETDSGRLIISREVPARKEADTKSETVVILRPGNEVTKEARMGAYTLVSWPSKEGKKWGWVETAKAQKFTAPTTTTTTTAPKPDATVAPRPEFGRPTFNRDAGR